MVRSIVHVVADYGLHGDLAWAEVADALHAAFGGDVAVTQTRVPFGNTIAAAFCAYQVGSRRAQQVGERSLVLVNVDPRRHTQEPIANGAGSPLHVGVLTNRVRIVGPGAAIFAVAQHVGALHALYRTASPANGQFRSRDVYATIVAAIARGAIVPMDAAPRTDIPPLPPCVLYVDGYGNIKTSLSANDLRGIKTITVLIGRYERIALPVTNGLFAVPPYTLHCYPGSSGPPENPFMEIGVREGSARDHFGNPEPGTPIEHKDANKSVVSLSEVHA